MMKDITKSDLANQLLERKIEEAKLQRKQKKIIDKTKFRQEVDIVRNNIEKRDEIWYRQKVKGLYKRSNPSPGRTEKEKSKFIIENKGV
jgi:hypothetical protein